MPKIEKGMTLEDLQYDEGKLTLFRPELLPCGRCGELVEETELIPHGKMLICKACSKRLMYLKRRGKDGKDKMFSVSSSCLIFVFNQE